MSSENPAGRPVGARDGISPARQQYLQIMSEVVAPRLAEFGFVRRGREFRYRSGDYLATVQPRPLRRNPPGEYGFEVDLGVSFVPEGPPWFWHDRLQALAPRAGKRGGEGAGDLTRWTVEVGRPTEPVAEDLLAAFSDYGWPAIRALMDDPGYPPDPSRRWARSFAPIRGRAGWAATRRGLEQAVSLIPPVNQTFDRQFAYLADPEPGTRRHAIDDLTKLAADDPRTVLAVLNRLAEDPDPDVRRTAALRLASRAVLGAVLEALQAAATDDEDLNVRWAARYALNLSTSPTG
jgi:HEAT repeats